MRGKNIVLDEENLHERMRLLGEWGGYIQIIGERGFLNARNAVECRG